MGRGEGAAVEDRAGADQGRRLNGASAGARVSGAGARVSGAGGAFERGALVFFFRLCGLLAVGQLQFK